VLMVHTGWGPQPPASLLLLSLHPPQCSQSVQLSPLPLLPGQVASSCGACLPLASCTLNMDPHGCSSLPTHCPQHSQPADPLPGQPGKAVAGRGAFLPQPPCTINTLLSHGCRPPEMQLCATSKRECSLLSWRPPPSAPSKAADAAISQGLWQVKSCKHFDLVEVESQAMMRGAGLLRGTSGKLQALWSCRPRLRVRP